LLKQTNKSYATISQTFLDHIIELVSLIDNHTINGKQAKSIFEQMYLNNKKPSQLVNDLGFKQIVDEQYIKQQLQEIINTNKDMVAQYTSRPERVEKMFIGLLMKQTKGSANPIIATKILRELLK
jgi:aspartyl-tRNA(Asn)/glutamyl-tRNA(Gln) amidotransferase subunit B